MNHIEPNLIARQLLFRDAGRKTCSLRSVGILVLVAGVLFSGCSKSKEETEQAPTVAVQVAPAERKEIQLKVSADAILYPLNQSALVPKISAPVGKFYVERGSTVHAGQLLAEMENKDLAGAVAESRGAYDQAEAIYQTSIKATLPEEIQKAELEVKATKETRDSLQKIYVSRQALLEQGAISAKEVEDSKVNFVQAQNQYEIATRHLGGLQGGGNEQAIRAAAGQLAAAKGKYEGTVAQLGYSRILSPINGVVTDRPVFPGEIPPGGSPIITVMDLSQVIARAHISQRDAAKLKVGDAVTISVPHLDAFIGGKVTLISPALDPNSTTVEVWVQAPNPGTRLKPGSSVRLTIAAETVPDAVVVPAAAVLTEANGKASLMVVDSNNKPHKKEVKLGIRDGDDVQITGGLLEGERIVTVGAFKLYKEDSDVLEKTKVEIQVPQKNEDD